MTNIEAKKALPVENTKNAEAVNKVDELSNQIKKLDEEINHIKTSNPNFAENKDLYKQVFEKQELKKKLEAEKKDILSDTQKSLEGQKPYTADQKNILNEQIENSGATEEQKNEARERLSHANSAQELNLDGLGPILGFIFGIFAKFTGYREEDFSRDDLDKALAEFKASGEYNMDFGKLIETKEGSNYKQFEPYIVGYAKKFGINPGTVLKLMIKEGSDGDVKKGPGGNNSAVGLGQITGNTWADICNNIAPKYLGKTLDTSKRFDAPSQILATCIYLDYCAKSKGISHEEAMIYYHMGPANITDEVAKKYYNNNPAVARVHGPGPVTAESYKLAAMKYYLG